MRVSLEFDFENYKINFCKNPLCKFFKEGQTFITYYDCFDYHISDDRRRKVTISDNKFNYSPKYYYDSTDNNLTFCGNSFEFYYHPLNYKSKKCEKSRCFDNFCPFFHKPEEKEFFENYRKKFTNIKFQSIFDPVFELCLQIDDKLKLNQPILVKKEDLIQIPENITITKTESISSSISYNKEKPKHSYFLNQEVNIFEDHFNEFKQYCKKIDTYMITKYICAFLNVRGGILYLGINDQGIVKGIYLNRKKRDEFLLEIDQCLKKFTPSLLPDECFVSFCPIYSDFKKKIIMPDRYVIEINVQKSSYNELYFSNFGECWVKRGASISLLQPMEIKNYIKDKIIKSENNNVSTFNEKFKKIIEGDPSILEKLNCDEQLKIIDFFKQTIEKIKNNKI